MANYVLPALHIIGLNSCIMSVFNVIFILWFCRQTLYCKCVKGITASVCRLAYGLFAFDIWNIVSIKAWYLSMHLMTYLSGKLVSASWAGRSVIEIKIFLRRNAWGRWLKVGLTGAVKFLFNREVKATKKLGNSNYSCCITYVTFYFLYVWVNVIVFYFRSSS